jgi:FtsP/CotA-like multicopper oxidase with cupredoxin domain
MKNRDMSRRQFMKYTSTGMAALWVGSHLPSWVGKNEAIAAVPALNITITDAIKEMHTHNAINTAECYFWVYKEATYPAQVPGCTLYATEGDTITITITNALDEPHSLIVPGLPGAPHMFDSGTIQPGQTVGPVSFTVTGTGTFLYYDGENLPVGRVMGLHGALISMPAAPSGAKWTPYANPTPQVQQLFDDLGTAAHWPGLAWEEGDPVTMTQPFRQCLWICHQSSAALFREVGRLPPGAIMPAAEFVQKFTNDAFSHNNHDIDSASRLPQYFSVTGQTGHYCHNNPVITPMARVGEPFLVRVLNAGLMTHSMHLHCNHYYVISVDGVVQGTPVGNVPDNASLLKPGVIWVDTFTLNPPGYPSSQYDMVIPYMRSPDVPNERGIGRAGSGDNALIGATSGQPVWPPVEELDVFTPASAGNTDPTLNQRESPLCYPMHDHSEPSQTTQGGNYNTALISGMYIIGDRNITLPRYNIDDLAAVPGANTNMPLLPPQTFPMDMDFAMMLGLDQNPQVLCYGIDDAVQKGMQESGKDDELLSQKDRPNIPAFPH